MHKILQDKQSTADGTFSQGKHNAPSEFRTPDFITPRLSPEKLLFGVNSHIRTFSLFTVYTGLEISATG